MKTQTPTNPTLPSPLKFSFYLIAVAAICFLNWNVLKASDPDEEDAKTMQARLEAALVPAPEAEIKLKDWMLTVTAEGRSESEINFENRMQTIADEIKVEVNKKLEKSMLTTIDVEKKVDELETDAFVLGMSHANNE